MSENCEEHSIATLLSNEENEKKKSFLQQLNALSVQSDKGELKIPVMGYKELDLYQLYNEVQSNGGFHEVVKSVGTWSKIWKQLSNYDPSITDASLRVAQEL